MSQTIIVMHSTIDNVYQSVTEWPRNHPASLDHLDPGPLYSVPNQTLNLHECLLHHCVQ